MLTILAYKTNKEFLAFQMKEHKVLEVHPGSSFSDILNSEEISDTVLFQINLSDYSAFFSDTKTPHQDLERTGRRVLNSKVYDISKNRIHLVLKALGLPCLLVTKNDLDPMGRVIIKSNLNYGGLFERDLPKQQLGKLGIDYDFSSVPDFKEYQVLACKDVPESYWSHKGLVIERFIENKADSYIRIYKYMDKYILSQAFIPGEEIKKMHLGVRRENLFTDSSKMYSIENTAYKSALADAAHFLKGQNIDFGTIDIVTDDQGTNYIIDFNDTPFWGKEDQDNFIPFLRS